MFCTLPSCTRDHWRACDITDSSCIFYPCHTLGCSVVLLLLSFVYFFFYLVNHQLFLELFSSTDLICRGIYLLISSAFIKVCCFQNLCLQISVTHPSFPEAFKCPNTVSHVALHLHTPQLFLSNVRNWLQDRHLGSCFLYCCMIKC